MSYKHFKFVLNRVKWRKSEKTGLDAYQYCNVSFITEFRGK